MNINDAALRHLANRSRTVFEMKKHLTEKGFEEEEIARVVSELLEYGYLDDRKYCAAYFDYAFSKGKGRSRVFNELREKGVSQGDIDIVFEEYEPELSEKDRAREEAFKVLRQAGIEDGQIVPEKILGRVARRLQSKGYNGDIIYGIIGDLRI